MDPTHPPSCSQLGDVVSCGSRRFANYPSTVTDAPLSMSSTHGRSETTAYQHTSLNNVPNDKPAPLSPRSTTRFQRRKSIQEQEETILFTSPKSRNSSPPREKGTAFVLPNRVQLKRRITNEVCQDLCKMWVFIVFYCRDFDDFGRRQ